MKSAQKKTYAIGIDLGATTIKAGTVDTKGKILDQVSVDSKAGKGPQAVMKQMLFAIDDLLGKRKKTECFGIGVGSPGIVSSRDNIVRHPPNFADWEEFDVAKVIRKTYAYPVFIENDANAAALAECRYGAGTAVKDFLFVIWGTGVGGGIILNHRIYRGPNGGAGEIGHVSVDYNGQLCNCGNRGCIESFIGQRYLSQRTREILQSKDTDGLQSKIMELVDGNLNRIEPSVISQAAEAGDPIAAEILEEAGELLGCALASVLNVLDISTVIIGGGISGAPRFVFRTIESSIKKRVLKPHRAGIKVLKADLGNSAGIIGAASLVM